MPKVKVSKETVRGYLYAKVNEYTTETDFKPREAASFEEIEEDFKQWLWGTSHVGTIR